MNARHALSQECAGKTLPTERRPTELPGRPINSSDHPPNHPPTHHLCAIYVSTHAISSAIHVWWIASAACFQRIESDMPLLGVENEGKVNACPNLIAATHWILYTHMCQRLRTIPLPERMTVLPNQCANGYASARLRLCASGYANVRLRLCANGYTNVRIPCRSK